MELTSKTDASRPPYWAGIPLLKSSIPSTASELNTERQGPLNQGWLTQKFCLFPSELTIQFEKRINLKKVQLLSHQFLIASKIEFYIGDCPDDDVNYQSAKYTRLGYVELSPNVRTDFKARELKSVHVDAEGTFLKFVLHKNFVNRNSSLFCNTLRISQLQQSVKSCLYHIVWVG